VTEVTDRDLKAATNRLTGNHLSQPAAAGSCLAGASEVQVHV